MNKVNYIKTSADEYIRKYKISELFEDVLAAVSY